MDVMEEDQREHSEQPLDRVEFVISVIAGL